MTNGSHGKLLWIALAGLLLACGGRAFSDGGGGGGSAGTGGSGGFGASGGSGGGCEHNGTHYDEGDSFPSGDGCNDCYCGENGEVGCTLMACTITCEYGGKSYIPGDSFPAGDSCNTCSCQPDGSVICTQGDCAIVCEHNGNVYFPGDSFPAGDGCNTCMCDDNGMVSCTGAYCPPTCTYAGQQYQDGEQFPSLDGCNTCTCSGGAVSCTELNCPCEPANEWWREYQSLDPLQCASMTYSCPEHTLPFENACGCGCEQDASCPEWIDCMPPSPCDPTLIEKCPFSGITN